MKTILLAFLLVISVFLVAQERYIFDTAKVDRTTKLIGRYPQYDQQKTYQAYNFIIDDPATIKKAIIALGLGKEGKHTIESPDFDISITQNGKEVKSWSVSPMLNSATYLGHTYEFDAKQLKDLANKYPFDYKMDEVTFANKSTYEQYLAKQQSDKTFLFDYAPDFSYEGSFEIQFPRNATFSSPNQISQYLMNLIGQIVPGNEFRIGYAMNEKNRNNPEQFTMTIDASKKVFDQLKVDNLKNENWVITDKAGWFFYRTK